ncbi:MAG: hypothetical protein PF570_01595, partial [Candidatus Cloacimonetes bacterium]|nr:hypothetical protein [Candidatus Cloacimonadota bacterium]
MKVVLLFIPVILLVNCGINYPIKNNLQHESNPNENISILDSIYVDTYYMPVGKIEKVQFSSIYDNYPFPIEKHQLEYPIHAIKNKFVGFII